MFGELILKQRVSALVLVCALAPNAAIAQQAAETIAQNLSPEVAKIIRRNPKRSLQKLMMYAYQHSADGVVSAESFSQAKQIDDARHRIDFIREILRMDLNADGNVTKDELAIVSRYQAPRERVDTVLMWQEVDVDKDDVITISEALEFGSLKVQERNQQEAGHTRVTDSIMEMDVDGDGYVTIEEITNVVTAVK